MDKRPIGVFDSGLGGLSVVRELVAQMLADFPKATPKAAISVDVNPASM